MLSFQFTDVSTNFADLLLDTNNLLIQFSDQAIACQDSVKIKQFSTRTSKLSGLFNWIFTITYGVGYDFARYYISALPANSSQQPMNIAALNIFNYFYNYFATGSLVDCQGLGFNIGLFVSESLEAKVDTTVAFIEVAKFA